MLSYKIRVSSVTDQEHDLELSFAHGKFKERTVTN